MRLKYYLRGAGTGMIITAILLIIGNAVIPKDAGGNASVSTESTEREPSIAEALENRRTETEAASETASSEETTEDASLSETEPASENATEFSTEEDGRHTVTVHEHNETPEPSEAEEGAETAENSTSTERMPETAGPPVVIRVYRGEGPSAVAQKLQEAGVIEDAESYLEYLVSNGKNDYLEVGTFTLTPGSDFKTITDILTTNEFLARQ